MNGWFFNIFLFELEIGVNLVQPFLDLFKFTIFSINAHVLLRHSVRCYHPLHSVLYLGTVTLSQNEAGILIKWARKGTEKNPPNLEKKDTYGERFL